MDYRSYPISVKAGSEDGTIEAIVSVFGNVDSYNERVMAGAFTKSVTAKLPKGVWMHNWELPVAKTLEAFEVAGNHTLIPDNASDDVKQNGGLYIKGKFNLNTQRGREAYSDVKEGIIDEFSIGYETTEDGIATDGVRELRQISLFEWSPVLVGANRSTALVSIKQNMSFDGDAELMSADIMRFVSRTKAREDMRFKEGRVLSSSNVARIDTFVTTVRTALKELEDMIANASPQKDAGARMRMVKIKHELLQRTIQ